MSFVRCTLAALLTSLAAHAHATELVVTVNPDGTYDPLWLDIHDGDTVRWDFPDRRRSVVRVEPDGSVFPGWCDAFVPYDADDPNELAGPMPVASSGLYALGPQIGGSQSYASGDPAAPCDEAETLTVDGRFLCEDVNAFGAPLQEILDADGVTGIVLRFPWNTIEIAPGVYDWTGLDVELDRIVAAGKLYSLVFKAGQNGTPEWLFSDLGMPALSFKDTGGTDVVCGVDMDLANPTDPLYGERYGMFLQAVADHLQDNPAWYRALAYIKPSGANLHSPENRLPKRCEPTCPVCNTEVWAGADYTPQGIYDFYTRQFADIAAAFPGKSLSYMLIQAGFPQVTSPTEYLGCPTAGCDAALPLVTEQTEEILAIGAANHGLDFVVQHNGLQTDPPLTCHSTGLHPMSGTLTDFKDAPRGCPNPFVLDAGVSGQVTTFQTNNPQKIYTMAELDSALGNAETNSDAIGVEAYEFVLWQAIEDGGALDPYAAVPRTLSEWDEAFHARRRRSFFVGNGLPDPHPMSHAHTFTRTIGPFGNEIIHYADPARCGDGDASYGVIRILP